MSDETFLHAFFRVAAANPDGVALEFPGGSKTYRELANEVRTTAGGISSRMKARLEVVAVDLPRGPELILTMLAIWEAGGIYLPLDVAWPAERKAEAARRTGARLTLRSRLPGAPGECSGCRPEDPAYVIFTSGSSGRPKAVRVGHRSLFHVLRAQIQAFGIGPGDRSLLFLNPAFDASLSDVGTALLSGATLVIPPGEVHQDLRSFAAFMRTHRITYADLPPSLLPNLDPEQFPDLKTVVVGGEVCAPATLRAWARRARVFNVYGPTEATICSSLGLVDPATWEAPLLGRPLPGVCYHVCDADLNVQPMESSGELVITGPTLALGYVDDEALEASRFVTLEGVPAYRTGDRVLRREDGEYIFLGRMDRQVKVRGMLVEPAEIERCLHICPGVNRAIVIQVPGRPRLMAFFEGEASEGNVLAQLKRALPPGLLPARLKRMDNLPTTSSGKVDLPALALVALSPPEEVDDQEPMTGPEAFIAALFSEVLGCPSVSREGDFFNLGGDSFAVLEFLALAESRGLDLTAGDLFRHRTVAALAQMGHLGAPEILTTWHVAAAAKGLPIMPPGGRIEEEPGTILLTGSTGHLGSRILPLLLARDDRPIVCLVRRQSPDQGRLEALWPGRLRYVLGNVAMPGFGMEESTWRTLSAEVSEVWHLAGQVNLVLPYATLRPTNVLGVVHALDLLATGRRKVLHYASTLSVAACVDPAPCQFEETSPLPEGRILGAYPATKIEAEHLLQRGKALGHDVRIYRFGLLTGDSRTGAFAATCQLAAFLRGLRLLGCVPEGEHAALRFDLTPVDQAALRMVAQADTPSRVSPWHIANAQSVSLAELLAALKDHGVHLDVVQPRVFESQLRAHPQASLAFLSTTWRLLGRRHQDEMDLFLASGLTFGCGNSITGHGPIPPVTATLWATYFSAILPHTQEALNP